MYIYRSYILYSLFSFCTLYIRHFFLDNYEYN